MFHLRFIYFMNDNLLEWPSCQYGCAYVHMHTCARKCEMNLKDICPSVHAYMQMGVYIKLFAYMCAYMYICVEVFMLIHVIFG